MKKNIFQKIIVAVLSLLLLIEVTHNIYFNTKVAINPGSYEIAPYEETDYTYFTNTLESPGGEKTNDEILVVAESDDFFPLMAVYLGHKGIYDGQNLLQGLSWVKKRTKIIFALYDNELSPYQQFLGKQNAVLLNRVNGINFYSVILEP